MANLASDERLRKSGVETARGAREGADADRVTKDGTALTAAERRAALRQNWVQEILPTPPKLPGWHVCWLSTTNSADPIYKRMQLGYVPVRVEEVGAIGMTNVVREGEFQGVVACNEMLLFKIDEQTYQDIMTINHFEAPQEMEEGIYEKAISGGQYDSSGRRLDEVEGDYNSLGKRHPTEIPHFT